MILQALSTIIGVKCIDNSHPIFIQDNNTKLLMIKFNKRTS